jgi:(p)ppGpp synthase/HD superfamily hydrolase
VDAPFVMHPMRVMSKLQYLGLHDTILIIALMHDVIEDCLVGMPHKQKITYLHNVLQNCGCDKEITQLILHKLEELTKTQQMSLKEYFSSMSPESMLVKLADTVDNIQDYLHLHKTNAQLKEEIDYKRLTAKYGKYLLYFTKHKEKYKYSDKDIYYHSAFYKLYRQFLDSYEELSDCYG